jgi:bile-acid 7alpha-dehydratase
VIETKADIVIQGAAFYHDEYVKVDGEWKIRSAGYERTYEETLSRADLPSLKITANRFADS